MAKGIKYVKKAGMWCAYYTKNQKDKTDAIYWFSTREAAAEKLKQLQATT